MLQRHLPRLLVALLLAAPTPALAYEVVFESALNAAAFELDATAHTVRGKAPLKTGRIQVDPKTGRAKGRFAVSVAALRSGNDKRDRRMRAEVLRIKRAPELVFIPTRVERAPKTLNGKQSLRVQGIFKVGGVQGPVVVKVKLQTRGQEVTGTGSFDVPYVKWGLPDVSTFFLRVGERVKVTLKLHGKLLKEPA